MADALDLRKPRNRETDPDLRDRIETPRPFGYRSRKAALEEPIHFLIDSTGLKVFGYVCGRRVNMTRISNELGGSSISGLAQLAGALGRGFHAQ